MSEFKREERYIVVKLKHLAGLQVAPLRNFLRENRVPTLDCVVVEADWPEYEPVWQMIERRMTGQPAVSAAEELDAVLYWRKKHANGLKTRDALQALLTAADERADALEAEVARLNKVKLSLKELADSRADNCRVYRQHLTVALALAEKVRDASLGMQRKFLADLIDHLHQSGAALKPAEGGGISLEKIAQFNDDHDQQPDRDD